MSQTPGIHSRSSAQMRFHSCLTAMGPWGLTSSSFPFSTCQMDSRPAWGPGEGPEGPSSPRWLTYYDRGLL